VRGSASKHIFCCCLTNAVELRSLLMPLTVGRFSDHPTTGSPDHPISAQVGM